MPCYSPLHAYEGDVLESGKIATVWRKGDSPEQVKRDLPCYQCIGCRLERSRQWALRCVDEASLYERNCSGTLTFDDEHIPANRSLDVSLFQNFMKRLRKANYPGIRFFHCGEYGGKLGRPHYHFLLFNFDFLDKVPWKKTNAGSIIYRSAHLESLWPFGYSSVGNLSFESAAYVARYVMKKVTGEAASDHYVDKSTGELLKSEYVTMSRGCKRLGTGGIGKGWFDKFRSDLYPSDEKVYDGKVFKPPRFYDNLLDRDDPDLLEELKHRRKRDAVFSSDSRLLVKEQVKLASISSLRRPLEECK